MSYCLNPDCPKPNHLFQNHFCQSCGYKLLLKERYRAIEPLGQGGFGRTFRAVDEHRMNDACVIKQFLLLPQQNQKATESFNQEAVRLYELGKHPQIPDLLAHFEQDNRLYLVQELIDGETLLKELEQQGAFNEKQIREVLTDLLPILKFIHERGVIHRDIKPENIMRRRLDGKLILIDFGVSKQLTGTLLSQVGTTVGTPGYAPLEQMRGQVFPASDLYSLGVTCVGLLTQCLPTNSGANEVYEPLSGSWRWRECLPSDKTVSTKLGQILDKLLQEFVSDRYQLTDEVLQELTDELSSSVGIDYTKLRKLLAAGKWQEADKETAAIMLKVSNREKEGYLEAKNIEQFPCNDLRTIDQLWVKYSNGHFGFSVIHKLWQSIGGNPGLDYETWNDFGRCMGWRERSRWKKYEDLIFNLSAPAGHLPRSVWRMSRDGRRRRISSMASRLESCNIGQ